MPHWTYGVGKQRAPMVLACQLIMGGVVVLTVLLSARKLDELDRRVGLLRALSVGRSREEVALTLGKPNREFGVRDPETHNAATASLYMGGGQPRLGLEDVCVVFGSDDRVAAVYYTDNEEDRRLLRRWQ